MLHIVIQNINAQYFAEFSTKKCLVTAEKYFSTHHSDFHANIECIPCSCNKLGQVH